MKLLKYALFRFFMFLPTAFVVITIVFIAIRLVPGDTSLVILGESATAEALDALRRKMGLDQPLYVQYFRYVTDVFSGSLGVSALSGRTVTSLIGTILPNTVELVFGGLFIAIIIGVPAGIISAVRKSSLFDHISRILSLIGFSIPNFYLGVLLLIVFSVNLGIFPIVGTPRGGIFDRMYYLALPALSLGLTMASFLARMTRSALLDILQEDYVRTARAKGVKEFNINFRHALRNALIPIVTVTGLYISVMLAGSVVVEVVFTRPGLGSVLVRAIMQRDYPVIQGGILIYCLMVMIVNTITDILYYLVDPTIQYR